MTKKRLVLTILKIFILLIAVAVFMEPYIEQRVIPDIFEPDVFGLTK